MRVVDETAVGGVVEPVVVSADEAGVGGGI